MLLGGQRPRPRCGNSMTNILKNFANHSVTDEGSCKPTITVEERLLQNLFHQLRQSGFPVRFARSTPSPGCCLVRW